MTITLPLEFKRSVKMLLTHCLCMTWLSCSILQPLLHTLLPGTTDGERAQFRSTYCLRTHKPCYPLELQDNLRPSLQLQGQELQAPLHHHQLTRVQGTCTTLHTPCQPTFTQYCRPQVVYTRAHTQRLCPHR